LPFDMPPVGPTASAGRRIRTWKSSQQAIGPRTPDGKAKASRNAYKGGLWLKLRELSRLVNAVVREARDLEGLLLKRGLFRGRHIDTLIDVIDSGLAGSRLPARTASTKGSATWTGPRYSHDL